MTRSHLYFRDFIPVVGGKTCRGQDSRKNEFEDYIGLKMKVAEMERGSYCFKKERSSSHYEEGAI